MRGFNILVILGLVLAFSVVSVNGGISADLQVGLQQYYVFANTSSNINGLTIKDWSGFRNATIASSGISCPSGQQYCDLGTGSSESITWASPTTDNGVGTYLQVMYNDDNNARDKYSLLTSAGDSWYWRLVAGNYNYSLDCGDATLPRSQNVFQTGQAYNFVVVRNGANTYFYKNNTNVTAISASTASCVMSKWGQTSITHNVNLYIIAFWNRTLNSSELSYLETRLQENKSYNPYLYSDGVSTISPSFVSPTPANNSHNNTQIIINMSCNNANRFYLWFNGSKVLDNSTNSSYLTNVSSSGSYSYFGACYNSSASGFSANSSSYVWVYDVVYPAITFNPSNAFKSTNISQVDQYSGLMPLNITFTDNIDLYAYEINITSSGGIVMFNETNQSLSGRVSYTYNRTLNVSSWADGVYYIRTDVSDTHTAKSIPNYDVVKSSKKLSFNTAEGNFIEVESDDEASVDSVKDFDRYSFEFDFIEKNKKTRVYHLRSDKKIVYLENSVYAGHFIVYNDKKGNWIDFEGANEFPEVVKVSDFDYKITFKNSADKVKFHSIGGLNTYIAFNSWYKGSKVLTANSAGTSEPSNLSLNLSRDSTTQTNFTAQLVYNGTYYGNVSRSLNGVAYFRQNLTTPSLETTVSYYWLVNLTQSDSSVLYLNFSGTQSVFNWFLDNCTNSSVKTINLFVYEEETPTNTLINDMEVEVKSWINSEANSHYNYLKFSGAYNYSICLYPNLTMYVDLYAKYTPSGSFTHRFYLQNQLINTTAQNYTLYAINSSNSALFSNLQLTLRKVADYSYYPLILTKLQRYYVSEGVWRTVAMDQSGTYGLVSFDIKESNTDYKILFYDENNNILKTTDKLKFVCSSKICQITQMLSPYTATATSDNLTISGSLDNTTNILSISWSDPQANNNKVELKVSKQTFTGEAVICDVFQTGSAGSYNCNVTGYTGDILFTVLTSHSPYTPIWSQWFKLAKQTLGSLMSQGESNVWTAGIMITTIGFGVGFGPVGAIVGAILGLIINSFLGIASFITITFIIVAMAIGIAIGIKLRQ